MTKEFINREENCYKYYNDKITNANSVKRCGVLYGN